MRIAKETVTGQLRAKGKHDRAQEAECALPRHVDTERDAHLLRNLDISVSDLEQQAAARPSRR
jgi:hypothetical protein